jgi:GNAT superfamily N-acetyltransferase
MRDERDAVLAAHDALVRGGVLEPLSVDAEETRRWLDCELASLVENRFFATIDPLALGPEERALWEPRATSEEPLSSPHGQGWYRRVYWLRDGGARAGTMALDVAALGGGMVTVSSLYTLPAHRRRGVATRALHRAEEAVLAEGLRGLRVPTHWTWQPAVRFYLGLGMWLHEHRHSLVFCRCAGMPAPRLTIGEREAWIAIAREGSEIPLISAARDGDRLIWSELPAAGDHARVRAHARATLALALATRGYPLIREGADGIDDPESLARAIVAWEASERQCGHVVHTPRIPGLAYGA